MAVVCRMRVTKSEPATYEGGSAKVEMTAVYSPEGIEDDEALAEIKQFFQYTPGANFEAWINNDAASEQFQVNDEFYLRFDPIPVDQTISAIVARKNAEEKAAGSGS